MPNLIKHSSTYSAALCTLIELFTSISYKLKGCNNTLSVKLVIILKVCYCMEGDKTYDNAYPLPDPPTMATFLPGGTINDRLFKMDFPL